MAQAMHIFGYVIGFLTVCASFGDALSSAVADTAPVQVVTPDTPQSSHQPTSGPILQQQNQTGGAQKRLQEAAEEGNDLLNVLD
jgi:hypothetical protein